MTLSEYWHFMLDFGVLLGASTACIFSPSVAAVGHWFKARRGLATGIATTGGALGGVMWPLVLQYLIPQVGWAWTLRILGFIYMFLLALGCFFIRTRLPPLANATIMADFTILRFPAYAITVISIYLLEWALFIPITYISSYALHKGLSEAISYQCLIVLNVGSVFGRWLPGLYADKWGPFNTMAFTTIGSVVLVLAVWLPAGHTVAGLMTFSFFFGLSSGSNIGLTPVCVASLCRIEELGRYHSTCYAIVSIGCLTGIPIAGEILKANGGEYWGLILFTGMCYVGGSVGFIIVRVMEVGWDIRSKY
jgi:MFS family permease